MSALPPAEQVRTLARMGRDGSIPPSLAEKAAKAQAAIEKNPGSAERHAKRLMAELELHREVSAAGGKGADAVSLAKDIKRSPLYRDPGLQESTNWLSGAAGRLSNVNPWTCEGPESNYEGPTLDARWLMPVVWVLLSFGVLFFAYSAFRHFTWSKKLARKAKAMMEDDEPERTLDEWLAMADELASQGRFREAVRCLYLACLLKFDEAKIARFERSETNWEHLARIEASPVRPAGLDFRSPTKAFDLIWYGYHCKGEEDVDRFRVWYSQVTDATRRKAA